MTTAPQIKRHETWLDLPDEYEGFKVKVWRNAPAKLWTELSNGKEKEAIAAAKKLVLEHNGWLDFDGNEYTQPSEDSFWEDIPTELAVVVFALIQREMKELPNSVAPKKRRSKRG